MPPSTPTPKGEHAAETILDAAASCFLTVGYNGTSMRDIAKAAGYKSVAGLYNHYPDKEAVFAATLASRHPYDQLAQIVAELEGDHAVALLPRIIGILTDFVEAHLEFFRLVLIDFLEFDAIHARDLILEMQTHLVPIVARIQAAADLPPMPAPVLIRSIASMVLGFTLTENIMPEPLRNALPREGWQHHLSQILLYGLMGPHPLGDEQ